MPILIVFCAKAVGDARAGDRFEAEKADQVPRLLQRGVLLVRDPGRSALTKKPLRVRQWCPIMTLSSTVMVRNSARFWKVR
ncbi:MAG: hypothetical protein OEZ08_18730, partial [Betaproteobacteria bacterium]|nr:hypothetical protein [Betaproteobacteria bacterium]